MRDYTKFDAWKLADDLTVAIYERTRSFPREEIYGLTSQLRRGAYSVPRGARPSRSHQSASRRLEIDDRGTHSMVTVSPVTMCSAGRRTQRPGRIALPMNTATGTVSLCGSNCCATIMENDAASLTAQTKSTFACLHGLIRTVEKEAGKLSRTVALITRGFGPGSARRAGATQLRQRTKQGARPPRSHQSASRRLESTNRRNH